MRRPSFETHGLVVYLGDVLQVLADIPEGSANAVVTDPPYGERAATWDAPRSREWHLRWLWAVGHVMTPRAPLITFAGRRSLDILMGAVRDVFGDDAERPLQTGAWVHRQGHPIGDGLLRPEHEPFIVSGRLRVDAEDVRAMRKYRTPHNMARRPTIRRRESERGFRPITYVPHDIGPLAGTVFEAARNKPDEATGHPTQKPEAVMRYLVALACPPNGIVLDPFAGSGTTLFVARELGRMALGIEIKPEYVRLIEKRCAQEALALGMGEAAK